MIVLLLLQTNDDVMRCGAVRCTAGRALFCDPPLYITSFFDTRHLLVPRAFLIITRSTN